MGSNIITQYFQIVKRAVSPSGTALLAILPLLLIPSHPFRGEDSYRIEQTDKFSNEETNQLVQIYSLLKQQRPDLNDVWVWNISNTIFEESRSRSLDPMLVLAVINVESNFRDAAVSPEGARGLMQIHPVFANALAEEAALQAWKGEKSLDDPILNIKLGVYYLHSLKKDFRDLKLALTAYNWGPTEVKNILHGDGILPLAYATKVLSTYQSYLKANS